VIDSGSDLNTYAKIENQTGCCSPAVTQISSDERLSSGAYACCAPAPAKAEEQLFEKFTELLSRYNVNDYAASVKVFAIK
jgi:arsenite methyltransferase